MIWFMVSGPMDHGPWKPASTIALHCIATEGIHILYATIKTPAMCIKSFVRYEGTLSLAVVEDNHEIAW